MPATLSYPGVYIEEISSGVRTITGVATSITAFIGRTLRGPMNEPRTVNNFGEFERIFGGLAADHTVAYAVRDFFANGGAQAIIVRLYKPRFSSDADRATALAAANAQAQTAADSVSTAAATEAGVVGATAATVASAASAAVANAGLPGPAALLAAQQVAVAAQTESTRVAPPPITITSVAAAAANPVGPAVNAAAGEVAPISQARFNLASGLILEAASPGAWGNGLQIKVDYSTKPKDDGTADSTLYNLTIRDTATARSEVIRNVTGVPTGVRLVSRVLANESSLVRVVGTPSATRPAAAEVNVDPAGRASDSEPLVAADFNGSLANKTGLFALEKADLFNLLCVPTDTRDGDTPMAVYQAAMKYCNDRRAMLIVDSPAAWSANPDTAAATAIAGLPGLGLNGPAARNAALFFPRIKEFDPTREGQVDTFVPCGAIAGIFARTDATRGVWKAPAGLDAAINGIVGLQVNLSDSENGQLNPLGINSLRFFPAAGQVVWGSRTLRGSDSIGDEYKYIPVRRTALFIEETLYRSTQWVVFVPNDEPLWAQIRLNIGAFMQNLFRQGAFQGKSPRDAYFVKCDKETTTQNDIDLGVVNIVVGFAPLTPAEFVVIKLQQMAGQVAT